MPPTEEEEQAEKELEAVSIEQQDIMNVFGDEDDDDKGTSEPPQRKVERSSSRKRAVVNYAEKDDSTSEEDEWVKIYKKREIRAQAKKARGIRYLHLWSMC